MLDTTIAPDATSRAVARAVVHPFAFLPTAVYWPTDVITAGMLPPSLRQAFGLRWGARERLFFRFVVHGLRLIRVVVPARLRSVPHARMYDRRVG